MLILYAIILVVAILLTLGIYYYLDECTQLQKRLIRLGVKKEKVLKFPGKFWIFRLKELLYDKETELAEECFLTVEKDI